MKYLITTITVLAISVTLLYYLLSNPNFIPITELGEYNWINILTLSTLLFLSTFLILNLIVYAIVSALKRDERRERIVYAIKTSFLLTLGLLVVFILNFFHILNWIWGIAILLVVLLFSFII